MFSDILLVEQLQATTSATSGGPCYFSPILVQLYESKVYMKTQLLEVHRGHSESTFLVEGGGGSLKSKRKQRGGGGSSLSVRSLCEKKLPDFQTANFF